ncbi:DNA glycosylase AlkZ-like family protein, partial [Timonella senegalensis]
RAFDALASQGQDLPGVLWSLGLRAPGATRADVEELFNDGALMRNWPFRGTLHVMATEDIRWVLDAMGPRSLKSWAPRREHLGLTDEIIEAAGNELLLALDGGQTLSRQEATDLWKRAGLPADPPQVYHLILTLCNQGLIAWGPIRGKEQLLVSVRHWLTHAPGADS